MSELRAADPTLDALHPLSWVYFYVDADGESWGPLPEAHRRPEHAGSWWQAVEVRHARWFAVLCRECFPDAPKPGNEPCAHDDCNGTRNPYLSWQVPS